MLRDAYTFIIPLLVLALICLLVGWWLAPGFYAGTVLLVLLAAFVGFFFRDPERAIPQGDGLVVSPADGRVMFVKPADPQDERAGTLVSIFLSVFDVHINRSPIAGRITAVEYRAGKFLNALNDRCSVENEQNIVRVENGQLMVTCSQIAGVIARRIVFWHKAGDWVERGQRIGLIKFGSRTDLILPPGVNVCVKPGDRVRGGVTTIGKVNRPF
ncbi:MAG TPA: phosphatidylserine decarboxylase family protein [Blastocatellia bacterium]|nr:phosphatidylserine decarboxylase family protein [Blastocatellia bacterium]